MEEEEEEVGGAQPGRPSGGGGSSPKVRLSVTLQEWPSSSQLAQTPNTPSSLRRHLVVRQRRGAPVRGPEGEPASGGAELRLVPALQQRRTVEGAAATETSP